MTNNIQNSRLYTNITENTVVNYLESNIFGKIWTLIHLSLKNREFVTENKIMDVMLHWTSGKDTKFIINAAKNALPQERVNAIQDMPLPSTGLGSSINKTHSLAERILYSQDALLDKQ